MSATGTHAFTPVPDVYYDPAGRQGGAFVTFEGIDGVGKTTQCGLVCAALRAQGREVVQLREPGGTEVGERIRDLLLDPSLSEMDPVCELLLYEAARAQLVAQVVVPALERGAVVVSDRFFDSTTAYQGFGRALGQLVVERANDLSCRGVKPDRTVVLDMDPASALARTEDRASDRIELEGAPFQERVRAGFAAISRLDPQRVRIVDASGTLGDVWSRVREALADVLALPDRPPLLREVDDAR